MGIGGNRQVARRIVRGDRDLHVHAGVDIKAVTGKVRSIHRNTVAQRVVAEIDYLTVILMTVNLHQHRVARFGVFPAYRAGNHLITCVQLTTIQGVIAVYIINCQRVVRLGVQRDGTVRDRGDFVTCRIVTDQRHHHIVCPFFEGCGRHNDFIA